MIAEFMFLDGVSSEGIAPNIEAYDRHVPCMGDLVYFGQKQQLGAFSRRR
jgi:hypothetical protein